MLCSYFVLTPDARVPRNTGLPDFGRSFSENGAVLFLGKTFWQENPIRIGRGA
jgi:hypothetical protein